MKFRPVCAVVGLLFCLGSVMPVRGQTPPPLRSEGMYPRYVARGRKTVVSVSVPSPDAVQSADVSPAGGITVSAIDGAGSGAEQNIGWWDVTLDVANDAALGDRSLVLVLAKNRTAPVTIAIVTHAPAISGLRIVPPQSTGSKADLQMAAADDAGDLGEAPYVWFTAGCGGDPIVGAVRGTAATGVVRAALPNVRLAAHDGIPATGRCDLAVRVVDATGIESNILKATIDFADSTAPPQATSAQSDAGEWSEFASKDERFSITFPGQPAITDTTWISQFGVILPAHVYLGPQGSSRYSVTVVDYRPVERLLTERSRTLPALDLAIHDYGPGYWKTDVRGAIAYAASKYLERDAKMVSILSSLADLVDGLVLQLTNNADLSRTYASIYMHDNRLIVSEATVPKGYPAPLIFEQSLGWLDENGVRVRYQYPYRNDPDAPRPSPRGR